MLWLDVPERLLQFSRRTFSKISVGALGGLWLANKGVGQVPSGEQPNSPHWKQTYGQILVGDNQPADAIHYIRDKAPAFQIPVYAGVRYEDTVPDTLDIAEHAKLGIHVLTATADPRADYECHCTAKFDQNPPVLIHNYNDWVQNCEGWMEALPLLRMATGSTLNDHVDPVWMTGILRSIGPDGLVYLPLRGRPWNHVKVQMIPGPYVNPVWSANGKMLSIADPSVEQIATADTCERILSTMTVYYLRDGNPMWKEAIEKMIQRLATVVVEKDDYAYMPLGSIEPGANYGSLPMPTGFIAEENSGRMIQGLAQYYRATGYEPARDLAAKLTRYIRFHAQYYETDGTPMVGADEREWFKWYSAWAPNSEIANLRHGGHGHAHGIGLLSVLEYGAAVKDPETLAFARTGYEWMRANGSSLVGYFPEIFIPDYDRSETCINADMVAMALKLTDAGSGDYWDDADRWTRNHFLGSQLIDPSWVQQMGERYPVTPVAANETSEGVPERSIGTFAGWSTGSDWVVPSPRHQHSVQHCCTGQACRAMYYIWQHILDYQAGTLRINLLMNRASEWCDIHSYVPYEGRVDLKIKKACDRALVRMPEWVAGGSEQVSCRVNGQRRPLKWQARYVDLGHAKPGDTVTVKFPISDRTVQERIGGVSYKLEIRGNTVLSIDPPGRNGPLYERAYYRKPLAWKKVDRFVPDHAIVW
jgi:hypothetical protein